MLWLTLSVVSVFLAIVNWSRLSDQLKAAREGYAIQESASAILGLLVDCETGQRGFCLTGMKEFLEPLKSGKVALSSEFDKLVEEVKNDAPILQKTIQLRGTAELVLARIDDAVENCTRTGNKITKDIPGNLEVKTAMDKLRQEVAGIKAVRSSLIIDADDAARRQLTRATMTGLITGIIGVAAGVFAFWLARVSLEQQRREKALIEAKLKAERSSQEKTVFLANMSHEIRTPMNAIIGFGDLLADELATPRQQHYLENMRQAANSLLQLINDILDMAKIEAGVLTLDLEPTDPREICTFVHAMFTEMAAKKNIRLDCIIAEDLPRALLLDRIRLRQVLINLMGNAVKFTNKGQVIIRVTWEKSESTSSQILLVIEVQDTGVGIPADKLEAIFKPFVQAGAHRDLEKQGTGLGLSIVRRLTEMMGGTVTAASVPGQGSAFHLRLPQVQVSARLPVTEKDPSETKADFNDLRPASILVVDDSENNCELIAGMFAASHHRLTFGHNGQEAIAQTRQINPDVILLDIRMPGMDGREALAAIRTLPGKELTPIIAVTAARAKLGEADGDLRELFSGYIRKPFTKAELFAELANFLPRTDHRAGEGAPIGTLEPQANLDKLAPAAPELVAKLKLMLAERWPAVQESGAINDAKDFASGLAALAEEYSSEPLRQYARTLANCAENYLVSNLEKLLGAFPVLVSQLEPAPEK